MRLAVILGRFAWRTYNGHAISRGDDVPREQDVIRGVDRDKPRDNGWDGCVESQRELAGGCRQFSRDIDCLLSISDYSNSIQLIYLVPSRVRPQSAIQSSRVVAQHLPGRHLAPVDLRSVRSDACPVAEPGLGPPVLGLLITFIRKVNEHDGNSSHDGRDDCGELGGDEEPVQPVGCLGANPVGHGENDENQY